METHLTLNFLMARTIMEPPPATVEITALPFGVRGPFGEIKMWNSDLANIGFFCIDEGSSDHERQNGRWGTLTIAKSTTIFQQIQEGLLMASLQTPTLRVRTPPNR